MDYEVEGSGSSRPKRILVIEEDCQAQQLCKKDAMDHRKCRKLIKDVDVDGVYERRPRPLCPPHLITLRFNYMLRFFI